MTVITTATPAEAAGAFQPQPPLRRRSRPETAPAEPLIRSRPFQDGHQTRLGISLLFGGKAFMGSVPITGGDAPSIDATSIADLLEGLAGAVRRSGR